MVLLECLQSFFSPITTAEQTENVASRLKKEDTTQSPSFERRLRVGTDGKLTGLPAAKIQQLVSPDRLVVTGGKEA